MKYVKAVLFLSTILCHGVLAQYPLNWAQYRLMNPASDVTRSLAYRRQSDQVLVATRKYGTDIILLDAASGDSVGKLDTGIISGGTYPVNMVTVADDGVIYVCNLSAPQYTPGSTLKVYRYADTNAAPELVFDGALDGGRYGDSFAAAGSGSNTYLYTSGMGNPTMAVFKDEGGASLTFNGYVPLPMPGAARHGISPVAPGGKIWINGADTGYPPPQLINYDGTLIAVVPDTLASPGGTSTIKHLILGDYKLVTVTNAWAFSIRSVRYFEDQLGTVTFDYFGANSDSMPLLYKGTTFINNTNATTSLAYDSRRHSMLTLFGYNSVASLSLDSLLKASTPRDDFLTITVDGRNDFFPTDRVGASNGREMYLTWSEGKVFVGITGHTLVDPTNKNRMYVAFDLDPEGQNGSATPPEASGGVGSLPFKADVVYMVEPWNQPGDMIGTIYKHNGSSWTFTLFDGYLAGQGALASADEGENKLAEFAAIKNAPGIGTGFTKIGIMVYVAETGGAGNVLCAFPDDNPLGNGVSFGRYFYADSLGSGMFPTDTDHVQIKGLPTAVEDGSGNISIVDDYLLQQNYPNPFNPETTIEYYLPAKSAVTLTVYNTGGQVVDILVDGVQGAGAHRRSYGSASLSSGVYFYQLKVNGEKRATRKMLLMK